MEVSPYNAIAGMSIKQPFRANVSYFSRQLNIKINRKRKTLFHVRELKLEQ